MPPSTSSSDRTLGYGIEPTRSKLDDGIAAFFTRNGFSATARAQCDEFARSSWPDFVVSPCERQGYCSYTLWLGDKAVVQFRPTAFVMNEPVMYELSDAFLGTYGVPSYGKCGTIDCPAAESANVSQMHVYLMTRVSGISLAEFQETSHLHQDFFSKTKVLVEDLADFFVRSWQHSQDRKGYWNSQYASKVAGSLRYRLRLLRNIEGSDLKKAVRQVEAEIDAIEQSRGCLTHGDLVPANIMVDQSTGKLTGLIDWAEGESLPLGVGLYGLEEVLGMTDPVTGLFVYHAFHHELRQHFWRTFEALRRDQDERFDESDLREMKLGRRLGILLWRGIAFDDGRIDRVVEVGRDDAEIHKLRLFLGVKDEIPSALGARLRSLWRDRENVVRHPRRLLFQRPRNGGEHMRRDLGLTCMAFGNPWPEEELPDWRPRKGFKQSQRRIF